MHRQLGIARLSSGEIDIQPKMNTGGVAVIDFHNGSNINRPMVAKSA